MKFLKLSLIFACLAFFVACSSKVQTNKIPNEKKYNLPKISSGELKEQALNS